MRPEKETLTDAEDRLLDVLLEECSGAAMPPDLSGAILDRLGADPRPPVEPVRDRACEPVREPIAAAVSGEVRRGRWRAADYRLLAIAAGLLLVVAGAILAVGDHDAAPRVSSLELAGRPEPTAPPTRPTAETATDVTGEEGTRAPAAGRRDARDGFQLSLDQLPFGSPARDSRPAAPVRPGVLTASEPSAPASDETIVARLDELLAQAWGEAGVAAEPDAPPSVLADRLVALLGSTDDARTVAAAIESRGLAAAIDEQLRRPPVVDALTERWTDWLLGPTARRRLSAEQRAALAGVVRPAWQSRASYAAIFRDLLTASGSADPDSPDFRPQVVWLAGLAAPRATLAVDRLGPVGLDLDLTCGRCHDHPLRSRIAQRDYWSLAGLFQSEVHWKSAPDRGLVLQSPAANAVAGEVAFYETPEGLQRVAEAGVPAQFLEAGEQLVPGGRAEFSSAISATDVALARATVNQLWRLVYARPLAGAISAPDAPPALSALEEARDLLAGQLRAHRYDLARALRWVLRARAFRVRTPDALGPERMTAPREAVLAAAEREAVFAAFGQRPTGWRMAQLLAAAESFNGGRLSDADAVLLAQLAPREERPRPKASEANALSRLDQLRAVFPSRDRAELPAPWLEAIDEFDEQARHVFYAAGYSSPGPREMQWAERLRAANREAPTAALAQLWWALQLEQ